MSGKKHTKQELKSMLKARIGEKRIERSSKKIRVDTLKKTLKDVDIDYDEFKKSLDVVKNAGGFSMNAQEYLDKTKYR
jgi:hypothetical protein